MYIHNMNKNLKSILGITLRHFQIYLVNAMVDIRACVLHFALMAHVAFYQTKNLQKSLFHRLHLTSNERYLIKTYRL